jgi:hypothetical protein
MKCIVKVANMTNWVKERDDKQQKSCTILPKKKSLPEKILWDLQHLYSTYQVLRLERLSLNQILQGRHSGVTGVTVRNRAKEVRDKLELNQQGSFFSDRLEIVNMVVE